MDEPTPMTPELRSQVENMTKFQRTYCEYRARGATQAESAKRAGSTTTDRKAQTRVGYNLENTTAGAKEYIAYLQMKRAEAAIVTETEVIDMLRENYRRAQADGKYAEANKAAELLGSYIQMFSKGKEVQTAKELEQSKKVKNNVGAFKDEGEEAGSRLNKYLAIVQPKD